jgi:hypothetical protein
VVKVLLEAGAAVNMQRRNMDTPLLIAAHRSKVFLLFFFTLVTVPRGSLSLKLSDTRVYEPQIRARLGTVPRSNAAPLALTIGL